MAYTPKTKNPKPKSDKVMPTPLAPKQMYALDSEKIISFSFIMLAKMEPTLFVSTNLTFSENLRC